MVPSSRQVRSPSISQYTCTLKVDECPIMRLFSGSRNRYVCWHAVPKMVTPCFCEPYLRFDENRRYNVLSDRQTVFTSLNVRFQSPIKTQLTLSVEECSSYCQTIPKSHKFSLYQAHLELHEKHVNFRRTPDSFRSSVCVLLFLLMTNIERKFHCHVRIVR